MCYQASSTSFRILSNHSSTNFTTKKRLMFLFCYHRCEISMYLAYWLTANHNNVPFSVSLIFKSCLKSFFVKLENQVSSYIFHSLKCFNSKRREHPATVLLALVALEKKRKKRRRRRNGATL